MALAPIPTDLQIIQVPNRRTAPRPRQPPQDQRLRTGRLDRSAPPTGLVEARGLVAFGIAAALLATDVVDEPFRRFGVVA